MHSICGYLSRIGAAPFRECVWGPLTRNPSLGRETALCESRPVSEGFMINGQSINVTTSTREPRLNKRGSIKMLEREVEAEFNPNCK